MDVCPRVPLARATTGGAVRAGGEAARAILWSSIQSENYISGESILSPSAALARLNAQPARTKRLCRSAPRGTRAAPPRSQPWA